jgi:hypothetical protein
MVAGWISDFVRQWRGETRPFLLQLGHLCFQLLEKGSLLHALAAEYGKTSVAQWWGGQGKLAQRLLDALRYYLLPTDPAGAAPCRVSIVVDTS